MGKHQNHAVKRARELVKKRKADDKRAKRLKKKEPTPGDAYLHGPASNGTPLSDGPPSQPTEGTTGDGQAAALQLPSHRPS